MNEILLEYYQGKSKELEKCEGYLKEIIKIVKEDYTERISDIGASFRTRKMTESNEYNRKLEKELKDFFKFDDINIYWADGSINAIELEPNIFMVPNYRNNYMQGKSISNLKLHIMMFEDLITKVELNEKELLGFILHEIGHSLYLCPVSLGFAAFYTIITFPVGLIVNTLLKFTTKMVMAGIDIIKKELPILYNAITGYVSIVSEIERFLKPTEFVNDFLLAATKLLVNPTSAISAITGYGTESAADAFSASYGYGEYVSSGLRKLKTVNNTLYGKVIKNTGTVGSIYDDMCILTCELISGISLNPHPNTNQRCQNMLKKLKSDLAKGEYPPAMKKDLESEIKRMEEMTKIVSTNSTDSKIQIRQTWYNLINGITDGNSDFRQIFKFYFDPLSF